MEYNCGFQKERKWFRYRAAAIIVEDGCVLFAGNENEDYFYSIGGAVHMRKARYRLRGMPCGYGSPTQGACRNGYLSAIKEEKPTQRNMD